MQVPVQPAKCNRCGDTGVAWVTSQRTGKPYLVQAHAVDGQLVADTRHFHSCEAFRANFAHLTPAQRKEMGVIE